MTLQVGNVLRIKQPYDVFVDLPPQDAWMYRQLEIGQLCLITHVDGEQIDFKINDAVTLGNRTWDDTFFDLVDMPDFVLEQSPSLRPLFVKVMTEIILGEEYKSKWQE